jgi:outer membrane receptor for ferrienterochelin and colicins
MPSLLMIVILLYVASLFVSQNPSRIYGTIKDIDTGEPLAGANICLAGTSSGAAADQHGRFDCSLSRPAGSYTLVASYIGYHDYRREITLPLKDDLKLEISLKESAIRMDQIVVTGTRSERMLKHSPVTTQVINAKKIEESGATDLAEVLQRVTGVAVASNTLGTGTSTVELQGFGSNHVLVMVDGVKMIGRVRGELDISQISTGQIERVEIVKGATSTLYGSEAMGGVINIITKKPQNPLDINTSTQIGSYGKLNTSLDFGGIAGGWMQNGSFDYRHSSGYDLDKTNPAWNGTAFNKYQGNYMLKKNITEDINIQTIVNFFREDQHMVADQDFENIVNNKYLSGRIALEDKFKENLRFTLGLEYANSNHDQDKKVRRSGFIVNENPTIEERIKGELLFDWDIFHEMGDITHKINGGYSFETEDIETDRITGNGKKSNALHNVFVQDEIKISELTLSPGLRVDMHSVYGTHLSPKLSIMLSPAYNIRLRASYGHGFRAPSFKELYWDYLSTIGYRVEGNPDLQPEKSESINIGAEFWTEKDYHSRLNFFYNKINNLIDFQFRELLDGVSRYTMANVSGAQTWGVEWDMEYYPVDWFETSLGYYFLDSRNDINNLPLQLKPRHRANLSFAFKFFSNIKLTTTAQIYSRQFYFSTDDPQDTEKNWIEGYTLLHADLGFPVIEQIHINLGIKNITDYVNIDWGPLPGREYYITLNTKF